jgi:alkylation response protein AidB-like acyl-CoA dehydrogenase
VLKDAQALVARAAHDLTAEVVAVEELATASAAVAAAAALQQTPGAANADAPGLRGFAAAEKGVARVWLHCAAVAVGIGRAAVDAAVKVLQEGGRAAQDQEKPHWVVADAATEVQAGRLLTLRAAGLSGSETDRTGAIAIARLAATRAAQQAVDAALRVAGPDAYTRGSVLERLARDIRAVSLLMGSEDELRAAAADSLLPQQTA